MIRVESDQAIGDIESRLCRVAQNSGFHVIAVTHFNALLGETARSTFEDAISFSVCHMDLYGELVTADIRFTAFLPCRIAAFRKGDVVTLETVSPKHFCRLLELPGLNDVAARLEKLLHDLMRDAAMPVAQTTRERHAVQSLLGACEGQGNMRASIPQRIDCRGTKVEDLAGTGKIDAPGG